MPKKRRKPHQKIKKINPVELPAELLTLFDNTNAVFDTFLGHLREDLRLDEADKRLMEEKSYPDWAVYYQGNPVIHLIKLLTQIIEPNSPDDFLGSLKRFSKAYEDSQTENIDSPEIQARLDANRGNLTVIYRAVVNELVSLIQNKKSITSLFSELKSGKLEALYKILEVDKGFLSVEIIQQLIREAQMNGDWIFLEKIGKAIAKQPLNIRKSRVKLDILLQTFWPLGLNQFTVESLYEWLKQKKLYGLHKDEQDVWNLRKIINRLRLNKHS